MQRVRTPTDGDERLEGVVFGAHWTGDFVEARAVAVATIDVPAPRSDETSEVMQDDCTHWPPRRRPLHS